MLGEIIAVGEEVLSGDVINSNAAYISSQLSEIGVFCRFHAVVGDIEEDIIEQLDQACQRSKCIVLCGGLGPTKDDLTKEAVARYLKKPLYEDLEMRAQIDSWFKGRHQAPTENNYKQALMIEGGEPLKNGNGTAPGVYYNHQGIHIFLLPGPQGELKPMFENCVLPRMNKNIDKSIQTVTFRLIDIGESKAVTILDDLMGASERLIVAPYAKLREVHIKVTSIEDTAKENEAAIQPIRDEIYRRLGQFIYNETDKELVEVVLDKLNKKNQTLSVAESCTGGLLSNFIVAIPGSSAVFKEGIVSYSNDSKIHRLMVASDLLKMHGAVSKEVAKAMAAGVSQTLETDYSVSITGIAGPDGGTPEKPVGLVYIGIKTPETVLVKEYNFMGSRQKIREQSAKSALIDLWHIL
jgi:nicotinamide-nucleotide amidase